MLGYFQPEIKMLDHQVLNMGQPYQQTFCTHTQLGSTHVILSIAMKNDLESRGYEGLLIPFGSILTFATARRKFRLVISITSKSIFFVCQLDKVWTLLALSGYKAKHRYV